MLTDKAKREVVGTGADLILGTYEFDLLSHDIRGSICLQKFLIHTQKKKKEKKNRSDSEKKQ